MRRKNILGWPISYFKYFRRIKNIFYPIIKLYIFYLIKYFFNLLDNSRIRFLQKKNFRIKRFNAYMHITQIYLTNE